MGQRTYYQMVPITVLIFTVLKYRNKIYFRCSLCDYS